jgi:hypothetical protein
MLGGKLVFIHVDLCKIGVKIDKTMATLPPEKLRGIEASNQDFIKYEGVTKQVLRLNCFD